MCVTPTSRAARRLAVRIRESTADSDVGEMYIGTIYRFCARLVLDCGLAPAETIIINEDDAESIMATFFDMAEEALMAAGGYRRWCLDVAHFAMLMAQTEHQHPEELMLYADCLSEDDMSAFKRVCALRHLPSTMLTMSTIFRHASDYADAAEDEACDAAWRPAIAALFRKMEAALYYESYKKEHGLMDFDDVLLLAYEALSGRGAGCATKRYVWCQVDGVQDMNPLQMKIIDLLMIPASNDETEGSFRTMMFLGDEQQAICSFRGARGSMTSLAARCQGRMFRLTTNYRSSKALTEALNLYATKILNADPALLLTAADVTPAVDEAFAMRRLPTLDEEYADIAQQAGTFATRLPRESTAVLVATNYEADAIIEAMDALGVVHYDLSGTARKNFYKSLSLSLSLTTLAGVGSPSAAPPTSPDCGNDGNPIIVATIHKARGMEFDNVIVANVQVFNVLSRAGIRGSSSTDEARRLLYVALSRARRRLMLAIAKGRQKILT